MAKNDVMKDSGNYHAVSNAMSERRLRIAYKYDGHCGEDKHSLHDVGSARPWVFADDTHHALLRCCFGILTGCPGFPCICSLLF